MAEDAGFWVVVGAAGGGGNRCVKSGGEVGAVGVGYRRAVRGRAGQHSKASLNNRGTGATENVYTLSLDGMHTGLNM